MFQEDASGWQVFSYGKLGEVTENIRTFALPFESRPYTFRMKYKYDSFNRMQQMTYPDGEVVSYRYDTLLRLQHLFCMDALGDTLQNIDYIYDAVSNITDITNNSNVLANGLGGSYEGHYTYDNLYRLIRSDGNWGGTPNTSYELVMRYHRNGRILGKELSATTVRNNAYGNTIHTDWTYNYADGSNKLLEIRDAIQPWVQFFEWDDNGNMTMHKNISEGCIRWYCWDEENRMQGAADCNNASIYQYDANGDRTYKFTGRSVQQGENGGLHNYATLYDPTLYASSYVVCTPRGYTKHYYAESERVASKIGNGCLKELNKSVNIQANYNEKDDIENPYLSDYETLHEIVSLKEEDNKSYFKQVMECLGLSCDVKENTLEKLKKFVPCNDEIEKECYWYHPDHLGSSSWITFSDGKAVEHLHYMPWGEDFVRQRSTDWHAMYTFSAKEKDTETGYSYFGSRYYSSDLSIWLSVDPMSDKYPSLSPYTYCANNPIRIIDPSGDSCAVLLAGHSVGGAGHMAILVQNDKKEWLLWSKNGDDDGNHKRVSGIESGTADDQPGVDKNGNIKTFKSIQEFLDSDYNTDNKDGKGAAYYTKAYMLPTTTEQDKTIIDGMKEKMNEDYHFFGNNCSEAVVYALGKAGVKLDRPQKGELGNFSYQRPINVGRGMIPRQAYNCIRELHPEGTQFRTNRNTWW